MKKLLEEFKTFALKGNVLDMAVGVVVGGAFTSIVNSLVADVLTPIISLVTPGMDFCHSGRVRVCHCEGHERADAQKRGRPRAAARAQQRGSAAGRDSRHSGQQITPLPYKTRNPRKVLHTPCGKSGKARGPLLCAPALPPARGRAA